MNTAAKVRTEKEQHPERFCRVRNCLWRIVTPRGENPCHKHPVVYFMAGDEARNEV
jgi:hypothetical protein